MKRGRSAARGRHQADVKGEGARRNAVSVNDAFQQVTAAPEGGFVGADLFLIGQEPHFSALEDEEPRLAAEPLDGEEGQSALGFRGCAGGDRVAEVHHRDRDGLPGH